LWPLLVDWALASVFVASAMFGVGKLLLREWGEGVVLAAVAVGSGYWLLRRVLRRYRPEPEEKRA
jgi:hypothetical protein